MRVVLLPPLGETSTLVMHGDFGRALRAHGPAGLHVAERSVPLVLSPVPFSLSFPGARAISKATFDAFFSRLVLYPAAALLVALYLLRLIVLDASSPAVLGTAALSGFVVGPLWQLIAGMALLRPR